MAKSENKALGFDVERVAELARLELSDKEKSKFSEQLKKVLDYFDNMKEVTSDQSQVESKKRKNRTVLRDDKLKECLPREEALKNAPATERGFVKVKAVFTNNE